MVFVGHIESRRLEAFIIVANLGTLTCCIICFIDFVSRELTLKVFVFEERILAVFLDLDVELFYTGGIEGFVDLGLHMGGILETSSAIESL